MDESALRQLRAEASREDYSSMASLAHALYENGLSVPEVMRECYGVDLPREFLVLAEADLWRLGLLLVCTHQPWWLAVPPARGGPVAAPDPSDGTEQKLLALDPDLLPLGYTLGTQSPSWENKEVLCYRLSELAAGRPTVFRLREKTARRDRVKRRGESLMTVLEELHLEELRETERQVSDWDPGAEEELLGAARELVERVEELRRKVEA
ncbi:hypothetical protein [Streptomyces violaceusniger]|uniref:Uncharacterized protein n=1 Tax=Streptomyces violaceusniger (strain Tu 4113) TaxID=653045 RepID=G2PEU5_STRV4|nr:hypothetical protein [Streptomyces violaceusniger]AEM83805.1 hypothetical protein Strvi_4150 [Streptomyces violaceusniger Tu 4113]